MTIETLSKWKSTYYSYLQYNGNAQEWAGDDEQHWLDTKVSQIAEKFQIAIKVLVLVTITGLVMGYKYESGRRHLGHDDQYQGSDTLWRNSEKTVNNKSQQ